MVCIASLVTVSFSVILPKNKKSRWHDNWGGFQKPFLNPEGLVAWTMTGWVTLCFSAAHYRVLTTSVCTRQTYSSSYCIFQASWGLAWLERLNSGRHYWAENILWSGTTFFPSYFHTYLAGFIIVVCWQLLTGVKSFVWSGAWTDQLIHYAKWPYRDLTLLCWLRKNRRLILSLFLQWHISVNAIFVGGEIQNVFCIILVGTMSVDVSCNKVDLCSIVLGSSTLFCLLHCLSHYLLL